MFGSLFFRLVRFAWGAGVQVTSSTADAVPLPLEGKALMRGKVGEIANVGRGFPFSVKTRGGR